MQMTSDREAEALAVKFMAMGYHAAILALQRCTGTFPGGTSAAGYSSCNAP